VLVKPLFLPFDHPPYAPAAPGGRVIPAYTTPRRSPGASNRCASRRAGDGIWCVDDASHDDTAAISRTRRLCG
jgi:hypothetical protein